jgi:protein-S-isoprenylcysteine O-methyltransferase Ste14
MWPVLLFAYWRLARLEEKEIEKKFGQGYLNYKKHTPMFFPNFKTFKALYLERRKVI